MKRKIKNLKNGDVFMVTMPSGNKAQCTMMCDYALRGATTVGFEHDGEKAMLSVDEYVDVLMRVQIDPKQLKEFKQRFIASRKKKLAEEAKEA